MSGGSVGGGGVGYGWPPFTAAQWQELEHQALIFKYLKAGLSVPPDLLVPIHRSLESISARLLHYPSLGYYSFYGKKIDPEPGRCRRTDGKKWRCSKDAHPDSKYCERHMNRGRYRSRKPVESQTATSPKPTLDVGTGTSSTSGGRIFQNLPTHSGSVNLSFGSHSPQLQMETSPYGNSNSYSELKPQAEMNRSSVHASTNVRGHELKSVVVDFNQPAASRAPADIHGGYAAYPSSEKQQKQHYFFGMEFNSHGNVKQEQQQQQPVQPFFDEWPEARESRSYLDCQRSNMNLFSSTQLSMGIDNESKPPHGAGGNMCNFTA